MNNYCNNSNEIRAGVNSTTTVILPLFYMGLPIKE